MQDLIFLPINVVCRQCKKRVLTSIEALQDNDEHICLDCGFSFTPNINVEALLKLMKKAETEKFEVLDKDNS